MKFLCEQCKAKYQIADEKAAGKTVRMKCRKCGYLIEVRATATESGAPPAPTRPSRPTPPAAAAGAPRPAPPRAAPLATSLSAAKSPQKPERSGALAGAMKSALQREEEVSAPVDMSDLSPSDEWYVAINGVPVGPIRMAEVRRKAAIGAVTEESLCWQEGLDEWRALRSFPELAAIVREAFVSGRSSMTPQPPEGRTSVAPPGAPRTSIRPATPAGIPPRPPPARNPSTSVPSPVARSNVVPITSRLATAEKLAEEPDDLTRPFMGPPITADDPLPGLARQPSVVPDPFASPPRAAMAPPGSAMLGSAALDASSPFAAARSPSISLGPLPHSGLPAKKAPPWMAIAMVAAATAFGVTAAIAIFLRPAAAPTPVVVQMPGAPATVAATATAPTGTTSSGTPDPTPSGATAALTARKPVIAAAGATSVAAATSTAPTRGPLDLHGLTGVNVGPSDDPGGDAPKAPGQCISEGQVQQVIGMHSVGLRRSCWERSTSAKQTANITVSLTIGADGTSQGVSASGDDPAVASCIAGDVKNWHFPAMGCSQRTAIPFHFVRQ